MAYAKHIQIARQKGAQAGLDSYLSQRMSKQQQAYKTIKRKRTPQAQLDAYCQLFAEQLGRTPRQTTAVASQTPASTKEGVVERLARLLRGEDPHDDEPTQAYTPAFQKLLDQGLSVEKATALADTFGLAVYADSDPEPEPVHPLVEAFGEDVGNALIEALGDEADSIDAGVLTTLVSALDTENGNAATPTVTRTAPARRVATNAITCEEAWIALGADEQFKPTKPNDPARSGALYRLNTEGQLALKS